MGTPEFGIAEPTSAIKPESLLGKKHAPHHQFVGPPDPWSHWPSCPLHENKAEGHRKGQIKRNQSHLISPSWGTRGNLYYFLFSSLRKLHVWMILVQLLMSRVLLATGHLATSDPSPSQLFSSAQKSKMYLSGEYRPPKTSNAVELSKSPSTWICLRILVTPIPCTGQS